MLPNLRLARFKLIIFQARWAEAARKIEEDQLQNVLVGDTLLAAAYFTYLGPFTMPFRHRLLNTWASRCVASGIPVSPHTNPHTRVEMLAEPARLLDWHVAGLPMDELSMENALLVTKGHRWPLTIDPQGQMNVSGSHFSRIFICAFYLIAA